VSVPCQHGPLSDRFGSKRQAPLMKSRRMNANPGGFLVKVSGRETNRHLTEIIGNFSRRRRRSGPTRTRWDPLTWKAPPPPWGSACGSELNFMVAEQPTPGQVVWVGSICHPGGSL